MNGEHLAHSIKGKDLLHKEKVGRERKGSGKKKPYRVRVSQNNRREAYTRKTGDTYDQACRNAQQGQGT